jgi:hypothetical protein
MQDPVPENIEGQVTETHEFTHRVDWGHVALSVAALAVVYAVFLREPEERER